MSKLNLDSPDALAAILADLPAPDSASSEAARAYQQSLVKPPGSLGRLEDIAVFMAAWQGRIKPALDNPRCIVFAGNHGVASRGVSAYPAEVTAQMVAGFNAGGAAINQLTRMAGAELKAVALDLENPTADFTTAPAMSDDAMCAAMQRGADAVDDKTDMLLLGEMGIGNTTAAAAIAHAVFGGTAGDWVGRGTGIDDTAMERKRDAVRDAVKVNSAMLTSASGIMAALGGREMAAIAGAALEARMRRVPVLLDGFVATAALLPLFHDAPGIFAHCLVSHKSAEAGHGAALEKIGIAPLLDLGLRLGEASGAATALPLIRAALATHNGMASFDDAGVSNRD